MHARTQLQKTLLLCLALSAAACSSSSKKSVPSGPVGTRGWTVLVYMTADNNLEADGLRDLQEMAAVGSGDDLRFVVQADRADTEYQGGVLNVGDWTSTKRFLVRKDALEQVADLGEVNMGLTASLAAFVNWGVKAYPGEKYMLVFWDHGGGWKGFGWDDSHPVGGEPDHLTLDRIAAGVQEGLQGTGLSKFDIIGFDACLMATLEVAESVKPYASYLLASEEVEPGHGWDWRAFGGGGALDAPALGRKVIDGFVAQAADPQWNDAADVTLSLVDLSKLAQIEAALGTFSAAYDTSVKVGPVIGQVAKGRQSAAEYAANPDPSRAYQLVDMGGLFQQMGAGVTGASALAAAVTGAVVYEKHGAAKAGSTGLSIYFPTEQGLYNAAYDALPGMDAWRTFLRAVFGGGAAQARPTFDYANSTFDETAQGLTLHGALTAGAASAITSAYIGYGLQDGAGAYLLGDTPAAVSQAEVSASWDWSVLQITQGSYAEIAYLSLELVDQNTGAANIPLVYQPGSSASSLEPALWRIVFSLTDGAIVSDNVYLYSGGGVAELNPAAGSRLRARVLHLPDIDTWSSSWVLSSDPADDAANVGFSATEPLGLEFVNVPSTTGYTALLRIENAAGEGDYVYVNRPVP